VGLSVQLIVPGDLSSFPGSRGTCSLNPTQKNVSTLNVLAAAPLTLLRLYFVFECNYPRRSRSAIGVDIVLTLDVCMFV